MTLTQITKIRGPGIHTTSNIVSHNINSSGIITAVAFKGPFTGSSNIQSGIVTATKIDLNGDIDVDGHTNLDNVSVAGVSTFSDHVNLPDDKKIQIGNNANGDLQIYHESSGNNSYIKNNTGILLVNSDIIQIKSGDNTEHFFGARKNASSYLFYDNVRRIETSGIGVTVTGQLDTTNIKATGITTTKNFSVGTAGQTLVGIATILDEDNMASNRADALATQQSIKAYVDTQVTAQDLDFQGDSGSGSVDLDSQALDIEGTANEIETSASGQKITIGLPNNVTIGNNLTVTGNLTVSGTTTTINSTTLSVTDNQIDLRTGNNVTAGNGGINVVLTTDGSGNIQTSRDIRWNNAISKWEFTEDGSTYKKMGSGGHAFSYFCGSFT